MPTVKFDPSSVSKKIKAELRRDVESLGFKKKQAKIIYDSALRSVMAGGDLHILASTLLMVEGMTKSNAGQIARSLNSKASAMMNAERQASLGITHAIWKYPNAPCMVEPFSSSPSKEDVQQDAAHRAANGKRYEIAKGLYVNGKWTWPGVDEGCKCYSRSVLPGM